jgi:hypothetical protein
MFSTHLMKYTHLSSFQQRAKRFSRIVMHFASGKFLHCVSPIDAKRTANRSFDNNDFHRSSDWHLFERNAQPKAEAQCSYRCQSAPSAQGHGGISGKVGEKGCNVLSFTLNGDNIAG